MVKTPKQFYDKYDYVKVRGTRKVNFGRREWNNFNHFHIEEGDIAIVPRGEEGVESENFNMTFYIENDDFFEIIDAEPDIPVGDDEQEQTESAPEDDEETEKFECEECGRSFDTERGLNQHKSQMHDEEENNKNEDEGE